MGRLLTTPDDCLTCIFFGEVPQPMVVQKEVEVPIVEYVDQAEKWQKPPSRDMMAHRATSGS